MLNTEKNLPEQIEKQATVNVSRFLSHQAQKNPDLRAVIYPSGRDSNSRNVYKHLTFRQLEQESDMLAHGLVKAGISRGVRTVLMVNPSPEFFILTFALFKAGAVPVVVDPGMGVHRMLLCLEESKPQAFIGISKAHVLRMFWSKYFRTVKISVTVGKRWFWRGYTLGHLRQTPWTPFPASSGRRDEPAAILFTTGSTGPAKGAVYTHGNFDAQIHQIQSHFQISPGEIDLPTFPLFALFDPALGMTAVIPDMDPTKPAMVDPRHIIEPIMDHQVTNMFGSPALLNRVGRFGKSNNIKLPSLKRVVSAGAPVSPANIEQFSALLSENVEIHTPYGATEAMPVASIASYEILNETRKLSDQGFGICIGKPLEHIKMQLIRITDEPIDNWSDDLVVPKGEVGEITVSGDLVTKQYFQRPEADAIAKMRDDESIWHRMGDLGWMDKRGRVWFCGRKNHRVITRNDTLYTIPCEAIFNKHPLVYRSALVGVGTPPNQTPVIIIEPEKCFQEKDKKQLIRELLVLAAENPLTEQIFTILFKKELPVDIRHNSKIFREKLAVWAAEKVTGKTG
jgi:acyl-CoA synthetase (AMP-forming)/AMP-acid ligase II